MMNPTLLSDAMLDIENTMKRDKQATKNRKKYLKKRAKLLQELEYQTGLDLVKTKWDVSLHKGIEIKLTDLHSIKQVVGDVVEAGKTVADDYDESNEIVISVSAKKGTKEFDWTMLTFSYRRELLATDACQVQRQVDPSYSYNALVCDRG